MNSTAYKLIEFFILFIVLPISFALDYPLWFKMIVGFVGFIYIIYVLLKVENKRFKIATDLNWKAFWKFTFLKFVGIALLTSLYVWLFDKDNLFEILINKPKLWFIILFVYSLLSVYPQELIYRTFYFKRYQELYSNERLFLFVNAIVFSLAHIFFMNALVIVLTFLGGILFALTFKKTKSTLLVSIEHAIYGCWLFTVGMGSMLGFPS
ncbi:CPBP family intramembrane glutamic endopeptidase [Flavobacteriaceae bacterium LMO-SS05]